MSHYVCLHADRSVQLVSTSSEVLEWAVAAVQQQIPDSQTRWVREDLSGQLRAVDLHKLGNKDTMVAWWLFSQLCADGWRVINVDFESFDKFHSRGAAIYHLIKDV